MKSSDLIHRIKSGDERVLVQLYEKYRNEFIHWSYKSLGVQKEVAQDAFQEAMLDFHSNVLSGKLTELTSSIKTYLFQIGKHKLLNHIKKEQSITYLESLQMIKVNEYEDFMEEEQKTYTQEQISKAINKLPQDCQEVLKLYYFKEYDMESVAREMNYKNSDTAKSKKSVCMKRLAEELGKLKMLLLVI